MFAPAHFVTAIIILFLHTLSKQHYVPPPDPCLFAKICNHTGSAICGIEKENLMTRLFLDDCDMFEYNCDNQRDYVKKDAERCLSKETSSSVTISPLTMLTSLNISTSENDSGSENKSESSVFELVTKFTSETVNITVKSADNSMLNTSCICPTATCPNVTTSITSPLTDKSSISSVTTTLSSPTTILTTTLSTKDGSTTTTSRAIPNSTVSATTRKPNISSSEISSTDVDNAVSILTTCTSKLKLPHIKEMTTSSTESTLKYRVSKPINLTEKEETHKSIDNKNTKLSLVTCEIYPKHCNRPHTWATTVKGETRDFFQILRAQYGNRVKILRATTHYPRRITRLKMDDDEEFELGHHNEI